LKILPSIISAIGTKIPVVTGPTAIGKTTFAISLAHTLNGEIVSVDSRQVYRGFSIGTAQPSTDDLNSVPHHLVGILDAESVVSSGKYAEWVQDCIGGIRSRGHRPILVGGSFLYLHSVLSGIIRKIDCDHRIRQNIQKDIDTLGSDKIAERLARIDPEYAKIVHPNDTKRLTRALEIYYLTGRPPSEIFREQQNEDHQLRMQYFIIGLKSQRSILMNRIEKRIDGMIANGWLQETRELLLSGVRPSSHAMQSLGYQHMVEVVLGKRTLEDAVIIIKQKTRQFAKKQITWMNKMAIDLVLDCDSNFA